MRFHLNQKWWRLGFTILSSAIILASCAKKEEDEVVDPLVGVWDGSSCTAMFTADEIAGNDEGTGANICNFTDPGADPEDMAATNSYRICYDYYAGFYRQTNVTFTDAADFTDATYNRMVLTEKVFYNADADVAAECDGDDIFATDVRTYSYQSGVSSLEATSAVNTTNGFPEKAVALNMQLISVEKTFHQESDSRLDSMNSDEFCTFTDWELDESKNVTDKDNCGVSDTKRWAINAYYIGDDDYADDGSYTSPLNFRSGYMEYRITLVDAAVDPKVLSLGATPTYSLITDADETEEAVAQSGNAEASRTKEFGFEFEYNEAASDAAN